MQNTTNAENISSRPTSMFHARNHFPGVDTWAKFSLNYILSHPAVTCVLTETANPKHAVDNLSAGLGRLPDPDERERMQTYFREVAS